MNVEASKSALSSRIRSLEQDIYTIDQCIVDKNKEIEKLNEDYNKFKENKLIQLRNEMNFIQQRLTNDHSDVVTTMKFYTLQSQRACIEVLDEINQKKIRNELLNYQKKLESFNELEFKTRGDNLVKSFNDLRAKQLEEAEHLHSERLSNLISSYKLKLADFE